MTLLRAFSRAYLTRFFPLCLCGALVAPNPAWSHDEQDDYESFYAAIYGAASEGGFGYNGRDRPLSERIKLPSVASAIEKKAVAAYFWGIPLVEMRRTQKLILDQYDLNVNEIYTPHGLNTGESVVAPNLDVLYVQGFIDFSDPGLSDPKRALVLTIPSTTPEGSISGEGGIFNVMQVLDAYTDVVGSFGTRVPPVDVPRPGACLLPDGTAPNEGGAVLLAGPDYTGGIPPSLAGQVLTVCPIPTNQAWLIGRLNVDAQAENVGSDYMGLMTTSNPEKSIANVRDFSYQYALTPLEDYEQDPGNPAPTIVDPTDQDGEFYTRPSIEGFDETNALNYDMFGPNVGVDSGQGTPWTSQDFFTYLGESVVQNPVPHGDETLLAGLADLGLTAEGYVPPAQAVLDEMDEALVRAADFLGWIKKNLPNDGTWSIRTDLGEYDRTSQGWLQAAVVARVGLGANLGEDGIYPLTLVDADRQPLTGEKAYELTFAPYDPDGTPPYDSDGGIPPVSLYAISGAPLGYWAVTIYDPDLSIVKGDEAVTNPFYGGEVYSLGSTQLENLLGENPATSEVKFYLQHDEPNDTDKHPYWLPVPAGEFSVMLRIYAPDMAYFPITYADGEQWGPPDDAPFRYAPPEVVPEPANLGAAALVVLGVLAAARRKRNRVSSARCSTSA